MKKMLSEAPQFLSAFSGLTVNLHVSLLQGQRVRREDRGQAPPAQPQLSKRDVWPLGLQQGEAQRGLAPALGGGISLPCPWQMAVPQEEGGTLSWQGFRGSVPRWGTTEGPGFPMGSRSGACLC